MAITGHKSIESLAIYQRVQEDEEHTMGMSLTFSLLKPEDAIEIHNAMQKEMQILQNTNKYNKILAVCATTSESVPANLPIDYPSAKKNDHISIQNAVVPFQQQPTAQNQEVVDFDLMELLSEFNEQNDNDLVMAATQVENQMEVTTTKSAVFVRNSPKKALSNPTFNNCKIGSIGSINIHIHKS